MKINHSFLTFALIAIVSFVVCSCGADDEDPEIPVVKTKATVETLGAEEVTTYSAILSGEVTDSGNCPIIVKGFCWAEYSQIPWFDTTRYDVSVIEGDETYFRDTLQLFPGTKYYVRSFVKNEIGTTYGGTIIVTTPGGKPTFDASPSVTFTDSSATFTFAVNNRDLATEVLVRYGTDEDYGMTALSESIDSSKSYSITISLDYGTKYYYRVDLKNAVGWDYATGSFQTETPDCVDIDGNVYKSVKIGDQIWITKNFNAAHYNDGTEIPYVTSDEDWLQAGDDKMGARCYYNNDPELRKVYGTLYNWYAIDTKKLAPAGWHVPTNDEWGRLIISLGMMSLDCSGYACREAGTDHWMAPNEGATNASGFTALPGGNRGIDGITLKLGFHYLTAAGIWWNQGGELTDEFARMIYTTYDIKYLMSDRSMYKKTGLSIRLVKD